MSERVSVHTPTGILHGELLVGSDGLPELYLPLDQLREQMRPYYRPATLPNEWHLRPADGHYGVLLIAWGTIDHVRRMIAQAEREEEEREERREPDEMDAAKADMEARGER